jgi:gliding motility-associated-like protein
MWIYDRRGVVIFESNSINDPWDGRYKGNIVPIGVYVWVIELQWTNNSRFETAGTVTLIR